MRAHRHDRLDPLLRMSLKERETDRRLKIAVVAAGIAFTFLALLVAPWVIPPTGIAAMFGYLRRRAT
jgi:hypothetical protein